MLYLSVYSPVNDKLSVGNMYEQFKGNVFMLKASGTTAVLTFCSTTKFFTLVLSRSHTANDTELQSVHNLVTRVTGKPIKDVKKYCENNAFQMQPHLLTVLILATGILLINFKKHCKVWFFCFVFAPIILSLYEINTCKCFASFNVSFIPAAINLVNGYVTVLMRIYWY